MARYSSGVKTSAGSTTLPLAALSSSTLVGVKLREIGVFNTTNTAVDIKLVKLSGLGTPGAAQTKTAHDPDSGSGAGTFTTTWTGAPTTTDLGYRASLGAAIGAGVIWTFGDQGIRAAAGTANGVGVIVENGTGQACQVYAVWDE